MTKSSAAEKRKILIVEDHPLFRAMLVQLISQELWHDGVRRSG